MEENVEIVLSKYPEEIIDLYYNLRDLIFENASPKPEERIWAKLPSFYVGEEFVRLIPFKDHINIESSKHNLQEYVADGHFTPKGMMQIFVGEEIPEGLKQAFRAALF